MGVLGGMDEAGQLSLIGVAFEPLCSQIWVVLGSVDEAGQLSLIEVAFEPLCGSSLPTKVNFHISQHRKQKCLRMGKKTHSFRSYF